MSSRAREAATAEVRDMFFGDEATDEVEQSDPSAAPDEVQEADTDADDEGDEPVAQEVQDFTIDPEIPEEIQALVDEPDFEAEAEAELEMVVEDEFNEYDDPRLVEERRLRIAAEKKAAHYEQLRAKDASKTWAEEAAKFYPLADLSRIDATSRRGFLRAAKADHEAKKPFVVQAVSKAQAEFEAERERMKEEIRAEFEAAWGRPLTAGTTPGEVREKTDTVDEAFRTRGLKAGVKEMLRQGQ